jgi:hypothetical protein
MDALLAPGGFDIEGDGIALIRMVTEGFGAALLVWAIIAAAFLCLLPVLVVVRRRRFRCAKAGRDVEVAFEERGLPGHRLPIAVLSCSAFDPPRHIACDRACLHGRVVEEVGEPVAAGKKAT